MESKMSNWEKLYETALQLNHKGDHESSAKILITLADEGYSPAQFMLALYYKREIGVPKDYSKAVYYYKLAADQGYVDAQYELAVCFEKGLGVEKDYSISAHYFLLAAKQGNKSAMFELAGLYETGLGVSRDDKEAAYWYKKYNEEG